MKHLVLLAVLLLGIYFGWRYMPNRQRFFVSRFIKDHLPWVLIILGAVVALLYASASTTITIF